MEPFTILALSGGGYCGLYTARILERIEEVRDRPLYKSINFVAGTSIGGIIALALSAKVPAKTIRELIESEGPALFCDDGGVVRRISRNLFARARGVLWARYSPIHLTTIVSKSVGTMKMSGLTCPTLVPAVSLTSGRPRLFTNYGDDIASKVMCSDAALATSAAPTYFPPHQIGESHYVDGGLIANNPDSLAVVEAVKHFGPSQRDIRVLSIGAVNNDMSQPSRKMWLTGMTGQVLRAAKTIDFVMEAQQELASSATSKMLHSRYLRVTSMRNKDNRSIVRIDRADAIATKTIREMADRRFDEVREHEVMRMFTSPGITASENWRDPS